MTNEITSEQRSVLARVKASASALIRKHGPEVGAVAKIAAHALIPGAPIVVGAIEGANGFRLPFEAEWEFAARGGQRFEYAGSDQVDKVAWHSGDDWGSLGSTQPVAQKRANGYGLYDMSGNVWEWCADDYNNPGQHQPGASRRVIRGGCWYDYAGSCCVSFRSNISPGFRHYVLGLRLSRSLG